jgi:Domain of unknown function (DUF4124)
MFNSKLFVVSFCFALLFSKTAEAKLYKWVDDNGVTHYGEVIPPEYANKDRDSVSKSGLIQKRPEKVDPATIQAKEEAAEKRKIENQATVEQQRRDNALLNTYSNENEIDQARDRSLVLVNARIDSNKMLLKSSQASLDELRKEADSRTKSGKKVPASLTNDITQTEGRVNRYTAELSKSEVELATVKARFEKDKELYRKLKGSSKK